MNGSLVCEQCKKACNFCKQKGRSPPRSARSSPPCSSCNNSSRSSCPPKRKCLDKPIYVVANPSDQTCIVVGSRPPAGSSCNSDGNGSKGGGGAGCISLRFPGSTSKLLVSMPELSKSNGCPNSGSKDSSCIQIKGNSIVKTVDGGLQIVPCKANAGGGVGNGGVQISVARSSACRSGGEGSNIQLSIWKGEGDQPSVMCQPGGRGLEISYEPEKRKLNMNHSKHTIASMINKRLTELEIETKLAERSGCNTHERR